MKMEGLANALANVQLKKVVAPKDCSAPKISGFESQEVIDRYQNSVLDSNIESWYFLIEELTFKTMFIPLSLDDAEVLKTCYEELEVQHKPTLSEDIQHRVVELENKLQDVISKTSDNPYVFVKLSSRSAKDAPIFNTLLKERYVEFLKASGDVNSDNNKIIALLQAGTTLLRVSNAKEAISLIVRSERIYQDMLLALDQQHRFLENMVVRRWVDIDVDMEFRGFVCNNKLTALSQYNHLCYFPRLTEMMERIESLIQQYFYNKVLPLLQDKHQSYIIDFALTGTNLDEIYVIELNPFLETTDGALFSWQKERDILENGPFEFRICTRIPRGSLALLHSSWRDIIKNTSL